MFMPIYSVLPLSVVLLHVLVIDFAFDFHRRWEFRRRISD